MVYAFDYLLFLLIVELLFNAHFETLELQVISDGLYYLEKLPCNSGSFLILLITVT